MGDGLTKSVEIVAVAVQPPDCVVAAAPSTENRTIDTLMLDATGEKAKLTLRHECLRSDDKYEHSNYFRGFALEDARNLMDADRAQKDEGTSGQ